MQATRVLDTTIGKHCQQIHRARWTSVLMTVQSAVTGRVLSVTGLGRHVLSGAKEKNRIKQIDRLAGNPHLAGELTMIYQGVGLIFWVLKAVL